MTKIKVFTPSISGTAVFFLLFLDLSVFLRLSTSSQLSEGDISICHENKKKLCLDKQHVTRPISTQTPALPGIHFSLTSFRLLTSPSRSLLKTKPSDGLTFFFLCHLLEYTGYRITFIFSFFHIYIYIFFSLLQNIKCTFMYFYHVSNQVQFFMAD